MADRLRRKGSSAFNRGSLGRAAGYYTHAIGHDATNASLHSNRSLVYLRLGANHAVSSKKRKAAPKRAMTFLDESRPPTPRLGWSIRPSPTPTPLWPSSF